MDSIRFLNFLHDFAAAAAQKTAANNQSSGTNSPGTDLASTVTAFETQLKALLAPASSQPLTSAPEDTSGFVIGGGSPNMSNNMLASRSTMLAAASSDTSATPTPPVTPSVNQTPNNDTLREIIAWRREQIDPMLHVKVGEIWDKQGITDPLSHPKLLADAQHSLETSTFRKAHMPGYVAQWEGDWRTQLTAQRQADEERRVQMAAASAASGFVAGGGSPTAA